MTVTASSFRSTFPEFADQTKYPDAAITARIATAALRIDADAWAELYDYGVGLYVAHSLVLATRNAASATAGGSVGVNAGMVSSKSVDKVSVSYDTGAATFENAGTFNLTTYGVEFWQLFRVFGAGGVQL